MVNLKHKSIDMLFYTLNLLNTATQLSSKVPHSTCKSSCQFIISLDQKYLPSQIHLPSGNVSKDEITADSHYNFSIEMVLLQYNVG